MRKNRIDLVQSAFLPDLLKGLESEGVNITSLIPNRHISKFDFFDPDKYIPSQLLNQILITINREVATKSMVADLNHFFKSTNMGSVSNYIFQCPRFIDLLELVIKYQNVLRTDYEVKLTIDGPVSKFSVKINAKPGKSKLILEEIDISRILDVFQLVGGKDFTPIEIGITSETSNHLESIFPKGHYNVKTSQKESWIMFDTTVLYKKTPKVFDHQLTPPDPILIKTMSFKVELLLDSFQPGFVPKLDEIASVLNLSRRTIERELKKENTSFYNIKRKYLQCACHELISNPKLSIKMIAEYLDFSNTQNFIRSFKTWTGITPMEYRALL